MNSFEHVWGMWVLLKYGLPLALAGPTETIDTRRAGIGEQLTLGTG